MRRLLYYPGCTLKTSTTNFEASALASAKALGLELVELPRWNCCGAVYSLATDDLMRHTAPLRVLIRAQEAYKEGLADEPRLVTLCAMCYNTLKRENSSVREDPERLRKLNEFMDREKDYEGGVEVVHLLDVLRGLGMEKISGHVVRPLEGLKVAPYYGCLLLRPRGVGVDDPDRPTVMEGVLEALGAEVVDIPYKGRCCGAYHSFLREDVVAELCHRILKQAADMGADVVALSCPLCEYNLGRQELIERRYRDFRRIPVVYFTQLMALAFGLDEHCGFEENRVDPRPLLSEKKLYRRGGGE